MKLLILFLVKLLTILAGCRLVVGQSVTLRRVVPVLGVPDALVPLDMPVCQLNLFPGYTHDTPVQSFVSIIVVRSHDLIMSFYAEKLQYFGYQ